MHHSHVDGVPVFRCAEAGELRATLRFGAGVRDEAYRTRGVSALVAALAVRETGRRTSETALSVRAATGIGETAFSVSGRTEDVVEQLAALCAALGELPVDGVAAGVGAASCLPWPAAAALNARYGAQASGLDGQERTCPWPPTTEMVQAHAATWFTKANAVLTLTGPEPVGLRLPLPEGNRPQRSAPRARYPRASWTHRSIDGIAVSVETPVDSAASDVAHRVLHDRVTAALAERPTPVGPVETTVVPHDSKTVVRLLFTPAPADAVEEVAATLWSHALRLARIAPEQTEVDRHRRDATPLLDIAAHAELFGTPDPDEDGRRRALDAVTPDDVRDAWRLAMSQAQLVVPSGQLLDLAGPDGRRLWCTSCWTWDELPPWGEKFHEPLRRRAVRRSQERHWTILTRDSVVFCTAGPFHTLRFDEVIAVERHGSERVLIGRCGCEIGIDPAWYRGGRRLIRALDEAVPAQLAYDCDEERDSHVQRPSRA
ncbi:peptidase M16 family protein [Streptomyces justiciae]|uniref:hypothetical protein n=1 Tax=Streptomyces justiciae TaxID=2780140 RepID=UPI0021188C7A|nr:hypothetical protein [Streptomyces justiciae]MCW8375938.1 hypothetical protein [Streptomyces justiciae]